MNLLNKIAAYFKEWDGNEETAPKMELDISELRYIASLNVERCRLETESRILRKHIPKAPVYEYGLKIPYCCNCNKEINDKQCICSCGQKINWDN